MGRVTFEYSPAALRDLKAYKKGHDAASIARIGEIQHEIEETWPEPEGRFMPESLKGDLSGHFSRRVNQRDRYVYSLDEKRMAVYVIQCKGHCSDR